MKRQKGKSQRREGKRREEKRRDEKNKEDQRKRERVRKHKIKVREKVEKSRNTMLFQCCVAPEGQKVSSLKRQVRCHLVRWKMKKCTPLWCEANFEVKICKTPQLRSTFGRSNVEKVHAVVARTTFRSEHAKNTTCSRHFWTLKRRFVAGARDSIPY